MARPSKRKAIKFGIPTVLTASLVLLAGCGPKADDASTTPPPQRLAERSTPTPTPTATPAPTPSSPTPEPKGKLGKKKAKGPTDITAKEVNFNGKTNVAIFTGTVFVKAPDFTVDCDKLTAFLKTDDKAVPGAKGPGGRRTPRSVTPKVAGGTPPPKKGGLQRAIAESTSERRVIMVQDKKDEDGNVITPNYSVGKSNRADYDAITKQTVLSGDPQVTQGLNRCLATDPKTKIYLIQDGPMRTIGPNKTILKEESGENAQGATEVTSLESVFTPAQHIAVFTGSVVANNPDFNVVCDKLTGYLKHGDQPPGSGTATAGKANTKTPAPGQGGGNTPPLQDGGLEKAVAVTTSERRVLLTQDKRDANGNVLVHNYSVGHADKATYDAATKDTVLTGTPDAVQGSNRCVANAPNTIIILNQNQKMRAIGPHTMILVDQPEVKYPGSDMKVPKAVGHASLIIQAVLTKVGTKETDTPGRVAYADSEFKVIKSLEGKCGDTVTVKIVVQDQETLHETAPDVGTEYIVFIETRLGQEQVAIKLIPSTEDALREVGNAISMPH